MQPQLTDVDPVKRDGLRELVLRGRDSFGLQKENRELYCIYDYCFVLLWKLTVYSKFKTRSKVQGGLKSRQQLDAESPSG